MKKFQNLTFALIGKSRILVLILFFSSTVSILAVNDLSVSGVTGGYTNANGTYIYQGLDGNSHNYWKHSTNNYYVYWNNTYGSWEMGNSYTDYEEYIIYDEVNPLITVNQIPWASPAGDANPADRVWSGNSAFFPMIMEEVPPLPVELTSFTANILSSNVDLNWQTATEVNNYGFEVERTIKKEKLEIINWETVGFVAGAGNSNSPKEYSFTDKPKDGTEFKYRLKQIDADGQYEYSPEVEVSLTAVSDYSLKQNFPNPFNPTTKIEYSIPTDNNVEIKVFNVLGVEVATLLNEPRQAGTHSIEFNSDALPSGIYFYKINSGKYSEVKKMILLR
jgi:hypothetical protein